MNDLPKHGRVRCTKCFGDSLEIDFDETARTERNWRITANPMAWGSDCPEIIVLGFSKGPTQAGSLTSSPHNSIAYKGSRRNVGKILDHVGLLDAMPGEDQAAAVDRLIADENGRFHFGSLIRCTVEQNVNGVWRGSGGGMLDKFVATPFGQIVASNCTTRFLRNLPPTTKLVLLFGMGSMRNYVRASFDLFQTTREGDWRWINEVAYTDGRITVVHVEHFASQGALIPHWLGSEPNPREKYGSMAVLAVRRALEGSNAMVKSPTLADSEVVSPRPRIAASLNEVASEKLCCVNKSLDGAHDDPLAEIIAAIKSKGYAQVHENKKLAEFISPAGKTIYLQKTRINPSNIKLMVHPSFVREHLLRLDGVKSVSIGFSFHSNMRKFPSMRNGGLCEETYSWQVTSTLFGLKAVLSALQ